MNKESSTLIDDNARIQEIVAALDDVDYYHRLSWFASIRQKRDAAMKYFESLLVPNEPEPEGSSGQIAQLVSRSMSVSGPASHSGPGNVVFFAVSTKKDEAA